MISYRTVLAILQSEDDTPRVLDFALPFAVRHNSHLIGLHAEALPIAMAMPMAGPAVTFSLDVEAEAASRHARLRALVNERARLEDVAVEWRGYDNISGDSAVSGIESARAADLVIAQQNDPDANARMVADVETLIFESGRPVLLLPYAGGGRGAPFGRVLIAWNGSREAARAVFDSLPLVKEAGRAEIFCVDPEDTPHQDAALAGTAIATAFARHGIDVTTRNEPSAGRPHGDVILDRLAETGADLLVMGAYSRSRLSEFIFGGVTRTMLQSMTVPTLMAW